MISNPNIRSYKSTEDELRELICRLQNTFIRSAKLSEIRTDDRSVAPEVYFLTNNGIEGLFELDRDDRQSADDGVNTIVTTDGRRYKRFSSGGAGGFISGGVVTFSGDGRTQFNIPHNQGYRPLKFAVTPMTKSAEEISRVTSDSNNLTVIYKVSPPIGEDNIVFSWMVSA